MEASSVFILVLQVDIVSEIIVKTDIESIMTAARYVSRTGWLNITEEDFETLGNEQDPLWGLNLDLGLDEILKEPSPLKETE